MASERQKTVLVVCVDRDNDLGRKTNIQGPVIGKKNNIRAAAKLALKDPEESDANAIFAAVKKFNQVKKVYPNCEIITLTGYGKSGFQSDRKLNEQLDRLNEIYDIEGFVLVTDGAEDDQIIPLLQSRAKIISKETVIIRQAKEVESIYYTIREALKDPYISRIVFGIPGIILVFYAATLIAGLQAQFFQIISLVLGAYLLLKGFGIEQAIISGARDLTESISVQRISFPFYIGSLFVLVFGAMTAYTNLSFTGDLLFSAVQALQDSYLFFVIAVLITILARAIDAIEIKKAFKLRKYFLYSVATVLVWLILDAATLVFLRQADLNFFLLAVMVSFVALFFTFKVSETVDVRKKITNLLVGLPVYSRQGEWLGKVKEVDQQTNSLYYSRLEKEKPKELKKESFALKEGKIVLQG